MKEEKSVLEEAERKLYKRNFEEQEQFAPTRGTFYSRESEAPSQWAPPQAPARPRTASVGMFKKIFLASTVFFLVALGASLFLFFSGGNIVSSENVDISVVGPIAVPGGEPLSLQVSVTNKNKADMEYTDLVIAYPEGTRSADGTESLPRVRKSLGVVKAGETVNEIMRASLYGKEGIEQAIRVTVEYRVSGSNAIFVKEADYRVSLSSAPLSISVDTLPEVNANQETALKISVASNAATPLENVLLVAQYPFGFEPTNANPRPRFGTTVWDLGALKPGGVATIIVTGALSGQENEERVFTFTAGRKDEKNERVIAAVYSLATAQVTVKRPFISVTPHIAGSSDNSVVVNAGERVPVELVWANNLPSRVADVSIEASLSGYGFDKSSMQVTNGVYRSSDNKIIWNSGTLSGLSSVDAAESGVVSFAFMPSVTQGSSIAREPRITISVSIAGRRVNDAGGLENVSSVSHRDILVNSDLRLRARALHFSGPFQNTGPMPPKVDTQTLYTVVWTLTNSSNDITNATVRGTLPPYMKWVGRVDPSSAEIAYDEKTGEVLWRAGNIGAGTGFSKSAKEAAFQVAFTPSISLVGREPDLVSGIHFGGRDQFTGADLESTAPSITTDLSSDPSFNSSQGQVVR